MPPSLLSLTVVLALWASMFNLGLMSTPAALAAPLRRRGALLRIVALDALLVPVLAWVVVGVLGIPAPYAIGLLLVGAASAGPLGVIASRIAGADVALAVVVVGTLEVANLVVIPAWTAILLPRAVQVPFADIATFIAVWLVMPLLAGFFVKARFPRVVPSTAWVSARIAAIGTVLMVLIAVTGSIDLLGPAVHSGVATASVIILVLAFGAGWLGAGGTQDARATVALTTAQRGNGVALGLALTAFAAVPEASTAVIVFGTLATVIVPTTALLMRARLGLATTPELAPPANA